LDLIGPPATWIGRWERIRNIPQDFRALAVCNERIVCLSDACLGQNHVYGLTCGLGGLLFHALYDRLTLILRILLLPLLVFA